MGMAREKLTLKTYLFYPILSHPKKASNQKLEATMDKDSYMNFQKLMSKFTSFYP